MVFRAVRIIIAFVPLLASLSSLSPLESRDAGAQTSSSAALQLIERYAPILRFVPQERRCDPDGEPYTAMPVEAVLGDLLVRLRRDIPGRPAIMDGPLAEDLAELDATYFLDFPGNPLRPGCRYEQWSREQMQSFEPTALVHLAREEDRDGLAIQYWFFYLFNDWNNKHEGDWELVQVVFDVNTVEEALQTEPVSVGFAQHGGGERASWDDPKLDREGQRPVVHVSRGSHASHFDQAAYLGWGENGTGVGCDITLNSSQVVPLKAVLVADSTAPEPWVEPWLTFSGRWGERAPWEFNGPRGPNMYFKWRRPLSWQDNLRDGSLAVPLTALLGPAPTNSFCRVTSFSADLLRFGATWPELGIAGLIAGLTFFIVLTLALVRRLIPATRLLIENFPAYFPAVVAVGAIAGVVGLLRIGGDFILVRSPVPDVPEARTLLALTLGVIQQVAGLVLVVPLTVYVTFEARSGRPSSPRAAMKAGWAHLAPTASALARPLIVIGALSLLPFGIIPAAYFAVRWLFVPQAVLLEGANPSAARRLSSSAIQKYPRRTIVLAIVLIIPLLAFGPLVGMMLLIYGGRSVELVNLVSGVVYAVAYPLMVIAATLYYLERRAASTLDTPIPALPETRRQIV